MPTNVDKTLYQPPVGADPMEDDLNDMMVDIPNEEIPGGVIDQPDGGAIIPFGEQPMEDMDLPPIEQTPQDANLVAYLTNDELTEIAEDIIEAQEADDEARKDWKETYIKGLDLLGMKMEELEEPFEGAANVTHPLLAEAVVQFQAQAYKELLPADGPVLTKIVGDETAEKLEQAARVQEFMNYQITEVMTEYDPNMDQLLFYLPLGGSAFKKDYYDPVKERTCSQFIKADNITVPYSATSLEEAPRIVHDFYLSGNRILQYQAVGFYSDEHQPLPEAGQRERSEVRKAEDELSGVEPTQFDYDEEYHIFEAHTILDHPLLSDGDIALPYIVTLDKDSKTVLAIRRNYLMDDPLKQRLEHFVHYKFLPGLGFYGFGLIHMIGGLSKSATGILRQLLDAGTFANMQGGFKAKGLRVASEDVPIAPGEWRDVDAPGGVLRDSLMPLPYKEPSQVLAGLLGTLVESGQRFASTADMQVGDTNGQQQPVGTTIAMLERGTKVMSSIHKRLHYAQRKEFRILARLISNSLPQGEYPYEIAAAPKGIFKEDFDGRIDILPVSDPNIFSMAQRVMLAQMQLEMAQAAPEMHNIREAYRRMYKAIGISDIEGLLMPEEQPQPVSPLTEQAAALQGKPMVAVPEMNHDVHIQMHLMFIKHPAVQSNLDLSMMIAQDILMHVKFKAEQMAQQQQQPQGMDQGMGQGMPPQGMPPQGMPPQGPPQLPPGAADEIEMQLMKQIMPQLIPEQKEDPTVALQRRQLDIQEAYNEGRLDNDQRKMMLAFLSDREELKSEERIAESRIFSNDNELQVRERLETLKAFLATENVDRQDRQFYARLESDLLKELERMNSNERIAARKEETSRGLGATGSRDSSGSM